MSDSQEQPWSDNPNAPKILHKSYFTEKAYFAGILICAILYGALVVLFFQCMIALLNPANRKSEGVKWGYISYTVAMFSLATVYTGMQLNNQSISYVDNREFPGVGDLLRPGPYGYLLSTLSNALGIVPNTAFLLNYCLADGLLLYRCFIFYSRNLWVIAIPFLMYLGSMATGSMWVYQTTRPRATLHDGLSYYSVSVALNVLLTVMIVARLVLRGRKTRTATGSPTGISGSYQSIVTMLIESSALYAVSSLVVIGLCVPDCALANTFMLMLAETQVIAPLLIIQRVANNCALTGSTVSSGHLGSFEAGSRWKPMGGGGTFAGGYPMNFLDDRGMKSSGFGIAVERTIDFHRDSRV